MKQASDPSAEVSTSGRSREGNHSKVKGSGKGKKGTKGILSLSHSKHLLHRVDKGERFECIDPNCGSTLTAAFSYKCRKCHLDNVKAPKGRIAEKESDLGP